LLIKYISKYGYDPKPLMQNKKRRKKLLFLAKVGLAITILLVILANVKVRDHLTLPEGTEFAGTHTGKIDYPEKMMMENQRITFSKESFFSFLDEQPGFVLQAVMKGEGGKVGSATLESENGTIHEFTASEIETIELRVGLASVLMRINPHMWCLSILIYFAAISITAIRWGILLKTTGLPQTLARAYKLTFIGIFFNNVVPGQTGGDWVRAYYIARENQKRKTDSIITVIVDRGLGITALAMIAAIVIPTNFGLYGEIATLIYGFIVLLAVGALLFFSKRLRRFFKIDVLLKNLPFKEFFHKIDKSIFLFRYRKRGILVCFAISFVVHMTIITSIWILGQSLGISLNLLSYMAYIPIIFIVSSLPLTPAGWGIGELLFVFFFLMGEGVPPVQSMALSLVFRLNMALISLLGGAFLLMESERVKPTEITLEEMEEKDAAEGE